jgi:hypothetical protein
MFNVNDSVEREWLNSVLQEGVVSVKFTKKDGSERILKCTLKSDMIPSDKTPKGSNRTKPSESIAVFDIENDGWRSFRLDSVKELNIML